MFSHLIPLVTPLAVTGTSFKDWVLVIAGNVFIVVLVVRGIGHWVKREWGDLIVHFLVAILLAAFVYMTDQTVAVMKTLAKMIFG